MTSHPNLLRQIVQKIRNNTLEIRNVYLDGLPHEVQINTEVAMNQEVSHARHLTPRRDGMRVLPLLWQVLYRFPNDLNASENRILCLLRG
jgi:hypothetical protein